MSRMSIPQTRSRRLNMIRTFSIGVAALLIAGLAYGAATMAPTASAPAAPAAAPAASIPPAAPAQADPVVPVKAGPVAPVAPATAVPAADLMRYVPDGACVAMRIRVSKLVTSDLWKKLVAPEGADLKKSMADCPLDLDFEKDVAEALVSVTVPMGQTSPEEPVVGVAMQLTKAVEAATFFKNSKPEKVQVPGVSVPGYRVNDSTFFALPAPKLAVIASSPDMLADILVAAAAKEAKKESLAKLLEAQGEIVLVAQMPTAITESLNQEMAMMRRQMAQMPQRPESIAFTTMTGFAMKFLGELKQLVVVADLSQEKDPVKATLTCASETGATFVGSGLTLLEPSMTEAFAAAVAAPPMPAPGAPVPAVMPPPPAPKAGGPAPEPVYKATFVGKEVRIVASKASLDRFITVIINGWKAAGMMGMRMNGGMPMGAPGMMAVPMPDDDL
jgi:hypothetical protein